MTTELTIPAAPGKITSDVIKTWAKWLREMAEAQIEKEIAGGTEFDGVGEKEWYLYRLQLEYCNALDQISEGVRQQLLVHIARKRLFEHSPEGWGSLADVIRDVVPTYQSAGVRSQLTRLAEKVAPFAEEHGIEIYEDPSKIWALSEAVSELGKIIDGDLPEEEKVERVREEVEFATSSSLPEVRSRYHSPRGGDPTKAFTADLPDGRRAMLVLGEPDMVEAVRQRAGNLIGGTSPGEARVVKSELERSKQNPSLLKQSIHVEMRNLGTLRFYNTDGELVEEVGT